jgi:hypothetical protein
MSKAYWAILPGAGLLLLILSSRSKAGEPAKKALDAEHKHGAPMQISKNFNLAEVLITGAHDKSQTREENAAFVAALKAYKLTDYELANVVDLLTSVMQPLRDEFGALVITGGGRPALVKDARGRTLTDLLAVEGLVPSPTSDHIPFRAVDFHPTEKGKMLAAYKKLIANPKVRQVIYELHHEKDPKGGPDVLVPTHIHVAVVRPDAPMMSESDRALVIIDGKTVPNAEIQKLVA